MFFSSCSGNLGYIPELRQGRPFKARICSVTSGILSRYEGHRINLLEACRATKTVIEVSLEIQGTFLVATVILRFPSTFKKSQSSSPFEALNSAWLSGYQREVRPPVQMRWGPRAFYMVSTGDLDIPSSCVMKEQPAFKPLQ